MEGQIYSVNSLDIIWLIITCLPQLGLLSNEFTTVPPHAYQTCAADGVR